ncbi:rRNA maturation RNase YbeY [Muriicola sp. SD30]|uniref:rRNA maturation RNase YbeY n=1 Tax=Muriicola sp. SD30 TaxID=3240936 RepID=UPI00351024A5
MVEYVYNTKYSIKDEDKYTEWFKKVIASESKYAGDLVYILTDDSEILKVNQDYLGHDYFTDIITFEYNKDNEVSGDIFISLDQIKENAENYSVTFEEELRRVMVHGILHLLGYDDKTDKDREKMRELENQKMKMFHVEQ